MKQPTASDYWKEHMTQEEEDIVVMQVVLSGEVSSINVEGSVVFNQNINKIKNIVDNWPQWKKDVTLTKYSKSASKQYLEDKKIEDESMIATSYKTQQELDEKYKEYDVMKRSNIAGNNVKGSNMKKIELKVGMEVKLRNGEITSISEIRKHDDFGNYPVVTAQCSIYTLTGRHTTSGISPWDIVAVKINDKWYDFPGEYQEQEELKINNVLEEAGIDAKAVAEEWCPPNLECNVNSPKHYMLFPEQGIEVIHVRKKLLEGVEKEATAYQIDCWSRAWEYLTRCWEKNKEEDIRKAKVYLDWLVESLDEPKSRV